MLTNGQCLALNHHESKAQVTLIMNSSPPNTTSINLFPDQLSLLKSQKKISKFLPQQNSYILHYQPCWNLKLHGTFPTAIITSRIIKLVHKTLRLKTHTRTCPVCISSTKPLIHPHFLVPISHVFLIHNTFWLCLPSSPPFHTKHKFSSSLLPSHLPVLLPSRKILILLIITLNSNHNTTPFPTETNSVKSPHNLFFTVFFFY